MKFNSIIWSNIRTNRAAKQGFEPSVSQGQAFSITCGFLSLSNMPYCLTMSSLYTQVSEDDCVGSFIACMYITINQYLLICPMKSMIILQADGLQVQKKKKSMTIWASKWIRESKSSLCAFSWRESQDPVVRRQAQCWWLKAGAQASLWLGIRLLFSFHKLISRWIWIISTLRRQNPVCGSLLCSSRPVSLLIIFHLLSPPLILPVCIFLCCYPQTPLLAEECPCVLQFSPVSINSALHSAFLIWSPNFVQSLIN